MKKSSTRAPRPAAARSASPLVVVALMTSIESRARIGTALHNRAKVHYVETAADAIALMASSRPNAIMLEIPPDAHERAMFSLRRLRAKFPSVPLVAYCWLGQGASRYIFSAVRLGASALALRGYDDIGSALQAVLDEASHDAIASATIAALSPSVPKRVRSIVDYCVRNAHDEPTVSGVARALGVHRRTLGTRLRSAGLPAPSVMISWSRLLVASRMMETPDRSVEDIALSLGFASGSALRGMLKRHTGLTPTQVRRDGGLLCMIGLFTRAHRKPAHEKSVALYRQAEPTAVSVSRRRATLTLAVGAR